MHKQEHEISSSEAVLNLQDSEQPAPLNLSQKSLCDADQPSSDVTAALVPNGDGSCDQSSVDEEKAIGQCTAGEGAKDHHL